MEVLNKIASFFSRWFIMVFALVIIIIIFLMVPRFGNSPTQSAQAEVVEKRFSRSTSTSGGGRGISQTVYYFYVSFKFSNGSVKEFKVGIDSIRRGIQREPYCFAYDSLNESETGLLTYKELKNAENRFFMPASYRLFISFEKDHEYGGLKVEMRKKPIETKKIVWGVIVGVFFILFPIWAHRAEKRMEKRNKWYVGKKPKRR